MTIVGGDGEHGFLCVVLRSRVGVAIGVVHLFRGGVERSDGYLLDFHRWRLSWMWIRSKNVGLVRKFRTLGQLFKLEAF